MIKKTRKEIFDTYIGAKTNGANLLSFARIDFAKAKRKNLGCLPLRFLIFISSFFVFSAFANSKLIKFATEATYPPYVYTNTAGKVEGFDADIVRALCKQMKADCAIYNQPWASLIPSLKIDKFDALFGGIAITNAREKEVDFTDPYYNNSVSVVGNKTAGLNLSKEGLQGKTIGVQEGTTFDIYLQEKYKNIVNIQRYPSQQGALMDLVAGRVDAVMGDTPSIKEWLKKDSRNQYALIGNPIKDRNYFGKGDGIAVKKGNVVLKRALDEALVAIKTDGTYSRLVHKYFGSI